MSTQLSVITELPARLQKQDIAAAIAAENAAAAGGIKVGGFPRITKKGSKFHIVDGDETTTLLNPPTAPGQPALPMMMLEVVVIAANPSVSKEFYDGEYQDGEGSAPDCKSTNGIVPDAEIAAPQHTACATCPKNQWGSKISRFSGKETKACSDVKYLVVLPRGDLDFKALQLRVTPAEFSDWRTYLNDLSARRAPLSEIQTNITFDSKVPHPKFLFSFGGFLTDEESEKVKARMHGADVDLILNGHSNITKVAALPAPTHTEPEVQKLTAETSEVPTGFAAASQKRTRAARKPPEEAVAASTQAAQAAVAALNETKANVKVAGEITMDLSYLPENIRTAVVAVGATSPAGQAILALHPREVKAPEPQPAAPAPTPVPPAVAQAVNNVAISLKDKLAAALAAGKAARVA